MSQTIQFLGRSKFLKSEQRNQYRKLLETIATQEGYEILSLVYVFQTDDELLQINQDHLQHDDYTDIITFDLSDIEASIDGEIYISKDRISDNAVKYNVDFETELTRVLSHGLLHLCGYKDKTDQDAQTMRKMEEQALHIYKNQIKKLGTA